MNEPVDLAAYQIAKLIMREWHDSYSDSGAIWERSWDAVQQAKKANSPEIMARAYEIARERWEKHDFAE